MIPGRDELDLLAAFRGGVAALSPEVLREDVDERVEDGRFLVVRVG